MAILQMELKLKGWITYLLLDKSVVEYGTDYNSPIFQDSVLNTAPFFLQGPHSLHYGERDLGSQGAKLWPELCVLLSPVVHCWPRNSVYSTAL